MSLFQNVRDLAHWMDTNLIIERFVDHAQKMHELPEEYLADALPVARKVALALGCEDYNVLQVRLTSFAQ